MAVTVQDRVKKLSSQVENKLTPSSSVRPSGTKVSQRANAAAKTLRQIAPAKTRSKVEEVKERAAKARTATPTDLSTVDSGTLIKSLFTQANRYSSAPDALKPIFAGSFSSVYNAYKSGLSDPNSALYNPYSRATNYKAIEGLAQYGYDATQMTDDELRGLLKYKRTTDTGYNAAAPTKSSTPEQNAAYWAQEYLEASERTSAAEAELAEMQRTVDYYANTLGLSDSEIVQRINDSKEFPTLRQMQEARTTGGATLLNRAIDYAGDDTVMGMIFSARNGGTSLGSYALNAGAYAAGIGSRYEADEEALARRDASNVDTYNPYAGGTTLEELGLRYNVGAFDRNWLEQNKSLLNTDEADDYRKIKAAVENTEAAEKELAELQEWVQEQQTRGKTAEEIREKMADEDFWDDYKTLKKMEDARQNGTSLALGSGVNYTSGSFSQYIDSLFPEPVQEEIAPEDFSVSSYYNEGGDQNILHNEVARWLNGRGTTSAEGEAFVQKYGWLFGGETFDRTATDAHETYDSRLFRPREGGLFKIGKFERTELGKTAYEQLAQAQEAAAEGVLSNDDYVTFAMTVAEQMEQAEAAGLSLEDYLHNGQGQLPEIGKVIEENRAAKKLQDEEREKAASIAMRESIEEADAAFARGTATDEQRDLIKSIRNMDVIDAVAVSPDIAASRKNLTAELTGYAQTNMVGKLVSLYGAMHTVEADIAREAADNIANIAVGYYDEDYKRAAMMGMDMETYYATYPERQIPVEEAYERAYTSYTNTWSSVWETIGKQAEQAAAGQMVVPRMSLTAALKQSQADSAAFDAEADKTEYQGEGVGALRTAKSAAIAGSLAAAEGPVSAVQYFITSANDAAVEAANRATYGNDPAAYREALVQGIASINDEEERAAWEYLLNNYEGDIYNVTMNFADERVKNAMRTIQRNAAEVEDFMLKHGTEAENAAFRFGTSAVSNTIYMAETTALTAVGAPAMLATSVVYGVPSGAEMGRRLESAGLSESAAKGAALGYSVITGWLESSVLGEYLPNLASGKSTSLVKRGYSWLTGKNPETVSKVVNWLVSMPISEGTQEALEYTVGAAYEGVWQSVAAGDLRKAGEFIDQNFSRDELLENGVMGAFMAPLLGAVGAGMSRAGTVFRSTEKAREILENGEATAEDMHEFIDAFEEDSQNEEFIAQAEAVATEQARAEAVVAMIQQGAMAEVEQSAEVQRAAETAKQADAATQTAQKAQKRHASAAAFAEQATTLFLENPSDPALAKQVSEATAEVAEAQNAAIEAEEAAKTAQSAAEEAARVADAVKEQKLAEIREAANATVQATAEQEAPKPTMRDRNTDNIKERGMKPFVLENESSLEYMQAAAEILLEDFGKSTPGQRIMLGDGTWTGQKRSTTPEIASLLDMGVTYTSLEKIIRAYADGDTEYIRKHPGAAKKLELVLDQMVAEGYTDIEGNRIDGMDDYREMMGYAPRTEAPVPTDANGDLLFYNGGSAASAAARAAANPEAEVDSPVRVARRLASELKMGAYTGPRSSRAQYHWFSNYIQMNTRESADYLRSMHEIGHGLSKRLNMTATDEMVNSGMFGDNAAEAFAEFVSAYMADRGVAMQLAGADFVSEFERRLREEGVYQYINRAATEVRNYFSASAEAKVDAQVVNRSDTKRGETEKLRKFMTQLVDHAFAARRVDAMANSPEYGLEDAMHYRPYHKRMTEGILTRTLVDANGDPLGGSFADMLADNGITVQNANDLIRYKLAVHALDRAAQGTPVFGENVTEDELNRIIDNAPENVVRAAEAWDAWWEKFSHAWLVDTGIVTEEHYSDWRTKYPHYIPTFRDVNGDMQDVSRGSSGRGGWTFHAATGSDLDIINPLDSVPELVASIVNRVADNTVGQKFDELYAANEDMGIIAKVVPALEVDPTASNTGDTFADFARTQHRPNSITVHRANGQTVVYEFADKLLYDAMSSSGPAAVTGLLKAAQTLNRTVAGLTTSANPVFGGRNVLRDVPKAVTYGSFAATELDALPKWASNLWNVAVGKDGNVSEYENLGGGGWSIVDASTAKGRVELRNKIVQGYRGETIKESAGLFGKKLFDTITLSKFNEILEQTTRQTEFNSAQNRALRATGVEGRRKAFLAAQDVTVDFARYGNSQSYATLKALVPFFGPSVQGLAQQAQMVVDAFAGETEADRAVARQRLGKTALTYGMRAALQIALVAMCFDDDDREAYGQLADDMKGQNLIIPAKWLAGRDTERRFIRIPMAQGIIDNALYAGFLDSMSDMTNIDEASIEFLDVASRIIGDALPVDVTSISGVFNSTVLAVPYAIASNTNWYGSPIVNANLQLLHATQQFNETTPTIFVDLSKAVYETTGMEWSPLMLQYVAEQYTGFFGQVLIPFIGRDQATQKWSASTGAQNVLRKLRNGYTIEPLFSNDISGAYYDNSERIARIVKTGEAHDLPYIGSYADRDDALSAAEELEEEYSRINKEVKALTKEINEINSDASLSSGERVMMAKAPTQERLELMTEYNELYDEYMQEYGQKTFWQRIFDLAQ